MNVSPDRSDAAPAPGRPLLPPASLGVIGSGQLGRMFIQAAQRMGYRAGVLSETEDTPAAQVAHWTVMGRDDRLPALRAFCQRAEAVTVEFENVSAPALRWLARHRPVRPGWRTLWVAQNRLREKTFLARHGIPHAPWRPVRTAAELDAAVEALGLPLILKTAASGYDGKGQIRVDAADRMARAWSDLARAPCVAEGWVDFAAEVSVVVARGRDGSRRLLPGRAQPPRPAHPGQHGHAGPGRPDRLPGSARPRPRCGPGAGDRRRPLRRVLPHRRRPAAGQRDRARPHNSGHLTIEAATASQFEQQVRALCGLPLGGTDLIVPAAMVNLLGDLWTRAGGQPRWDVALRADPGVSLHLYGKRTPAPGRKMGHLTVLDPDPESALLRALAARQLVISH